MSLLIGRTVISVEHFGSTFEITIREGTIVLTTKETIDSAGKTVALRPFAIFYPAEQENITVHPVEPVVFVKGSILDRIHNKDQDP